VSKEEKENSIEKELEVKKGETKVETEPKPEPKQVSSENFNFKNYSFPIRSFSGVGQVPLETSFIYQWKDRPSHYLVEKVSPAGRVINQLGVGDEIQVKGKTLTITHIERGVVNDTKAIRFLSLHDNEVTFQTCENGKDSRGKSLLTIWYAS